MNSKQEENGKLAYEAYSESVGGKSVNGDDLPPWRHVAQYIQLAWSIAAQRVANKVKGET